MNYYAHTPSSPGESWHFLIEHLLAVAGIAERFASVFGCATVARLCGLIHDTGKFSNAFQKYLLACHAARLAGNAPPRAGSAEHKAVGTQLAHDLLPPITADAVAWCVMGHHGGLHSKSEVCGDFPARRARVDDFDTVVRTAIEQLGDNLRNVDIQQTLLPTEARGDWIAHEMMMRFVFSCLVDADSIDTEKHMQPDQAALREQPILLQDVVEQWIATLGTHIASLHRPGAQSAVARVRNEVHEACLAAGSSKPGVFSLAVPTGGGKTLSSLAFALAHAKESGLRRVIYVIPYTSIIDQTASVFRDVLGEDAVLEHHSAVRETGGDEDGDAPGAAKRLAAENWDAPLIVTTSVQFFESLFANQPGRCRKLHNIANSVVILDEVQTLPLKLLTPLLSGLQSLVNDFGVSLVLCSATQPALAGESEYLKGFANVKAIIDPGKAKEHFGLLKRVTFDIRSEPMTWEDLAREIRASECSTLTVLNTKKDALALVDALDCDNTLHLSTLLCTAHRRKVIDNVKDALIAERHGNGPPIHLVSTQVIEAGVDLDFPRGYRALGPLDRIIQAAGRVNREGLRLREESVVVVFNPVEGAKPRGTYEVECDRAELFLGWSLGDRDLADPEIPIEYFADLYAFLREAGLDQAKVQESRRHFDFPSVAHKVKLIEDNTVPVLCRYNDLASSLIDEIRERNSRHMAMTRALWRKVQPFTVAVRQYEVGKLLNCKSIEPLTDDLYLWSARYDDLRGIGGSVVYDPADLIVGS